MKKNSYNSPNLNEALAFLQTRYPTIFSKLGGNISESPTSNPQFNGTHNPLTGEIQIDSKNKSTPKLIETLAHEISHSIRENRYKKSPNYSPGSQYDEMSNSVGYVKNPEEIAARQGGRTGVLNWGDFTGDIELKKLMKKRLENELTTGVIAKDRFDIPGRLIPYQTPWEVSGATQATTKNMGNIGGSLWKKLLGEK